MGSVAVVREARVANALRDRGVEVIECSDGATLDRELRSTVATLEAIVVGGEVSDPIQTAQRAYRLDPAVSVILLGSGDHCDLVRSALQLTPFLGHDVACHELFDATATASEVVHAAGRTRARRSHQLRLAAANVHLAQPRPVALAPAREMLLAHLVDTAPIGILALDQSGRVLSVNREASRLLGRSERETMGSALDAMWLGASDEDWSALLARAGAVAGPEMAVFGLTTGPTLEVKVVQLPSGRGHGYLVLLQDVTERVRAAEARTRAVQQAEEASRLKDEFIAVVSHELRTPMNAILGWSRLLRAGEVPPAKVPHALEVIERNAAAQARLIEDLLDVSRIIGGKMRLDLQSASLEAIIAQAIESVRIAASARSIELRVDVAGPLPGLRADPDRLQQVLWNLLSNAVKFTPVGGLIRVTATRHGDVLEVAVADDGEGIAAEALPYIFDSFRQAEGGTARRHGGLGLGLAIARRLVELHGGTVSATSAGRGLGATFRVTLPLWPAPSGAVDERAAPTSLSAPAPLAGVRVLVVDDAPDARDLVELVLSSAGATVTQAASVDQALERLGSGPFEVLLSDIGMPHQDGHVLIARVRGSEDAGLRHLPAIAISAYAREVDHARVMASGFDAFLPKPLDPSVLVALVRTHAAMALERQGQR